MDFILCDTGVTGLALSEKILSWIADNGLDPGKPRGQCYDGAGNMSGRTSGVASRIVEQHPLAVHVHCASHALNLCVMSTTSISEVRNMWDVLKDVNMFFQFSPKRLKFLEDHIAKLPGIAGRDQRKKLVDLCRTRWVARHTALTAFAELYSSVVNTLEAIRTEPDWNADSTTKANGLLAAITQFQFIATSIITAKLLKHLEGITVKLQQRAQDLSYAYDMVKLVTSTLQEIRTDLDRHHHTWWPACVDMASSVSVEPAMHRCCRSQVHRSNPPANSPEEYFRKTVAIPFLDNLISHLGDRFSRHSRLAAMGSNLIADVFRRNPSQCTRAAQEFADQYSNDLPFGADVPSELLSWAKKMEALPDCPSTAAATLLATDKFMWPGIHSLLRLFCTVPVTTCECERSASTLRRLRTYLRSSMGQDRLSALALLHIYYSLEVNLDEVTSMFQSMYPRRIICHDLLQD